MKRKSRYEGRFFPGNKFNHLTMLEVVGLKEENVGRKTYWLCRCDCGSVREYRASNVVAGYSTSCGCIRDNNLQCEPYSGQQHKKMG